MAWTQLKPKGKQKCAGIHLKANIYKPTLKATSISRKKLKNFCSNLHEEKRYYETLDITKITDNKTFWKIMKVFLSHKNSTGI